MDLVRRWRRSRADRQAAVLVLGGLAGFVAAVYAVVVVGAGALTGHGSSPQLGLSVLATTIVALAFEPVRARLERRASLVVRGGRPSPYDVLSRFSDTVSGPEAADEVPGRMAHVLAEGTGARWAEVWLVVHGRLVPAASWPPGHEPAAPPPAPDRREQRGRRSAAVHHAGELLGMLRLQEHDHQPLSPVEERLFTGLAAQAGLVLHGSRLRAELARRAAELSARAAELRLSRERLVDTQDAERRRLERDIHDGAQQHLVALAVNLRLAEVLAARSAERAEHILADQRDATRVTIETLVDLSRGIYPRALTEQGVVAALESAASRSAVPVEIRADGVGRYAPDVEAAVYFCCLEALQNAAKHSGASQVVVDLRETAARLDFCVSDDGRGFDEAPGDRGAGLRNMRDRVDSVGGHIALERSPAGGARISGSVPVVDRLAAAGPTR